MPFSYVDVGKTYRSFTGRGACVESTNVQGRPAFNANVYAHIKIIQIPELFIPFLFLLRADGFKMTGRRFTVIFPEDARKMPLVRKAGEVGYFSE